MVSNIPIQTTQSIWEETAHVKQPAACSGLQHADCTIVGAGITGLTTAALLARAGRSVIVVDAGAFGRLNTSSRTSAHLTSIPDEELTTLVRRFGTSAIRTTMQAMTAAIDLIESLAVELDADCDFTRVSGWRYCESGSSEDIDIIRADGECGQELGLAIEFEPHAPLPYPTGAAYRVANQAAFHPVRYLEALARFVAQQPDCAVFDHSPVRSYRDGDPCTVELDDAHITCNQLVLATHSPIGMWLTIHPRLVPSVSYCLAVRTSRDLPEGLFWDLADPYHYLRRARSNDGSVLVVGGEDHKTGRSRNGDDHFERLHQFVAQRFGHADILRQWSAELFDSADGLPYIGLGPGTQNVYVATGYSGCGLAGGTAAAMLMADLILGRDNPWEQVFTPARLKPVASIARLAEEFGATVHGLADRFSRLGPEEVLKVGPGEGCVMRIHGRASAVHRDFSGQLHMRSAVCPHMGCLLAWNSVEQRWDCPCHGSLFDADGGLIAGPATRDLAAPEPPPRLDRIDLAHLEQ
jgi:glycine/D-amino acid oxidase-like deaminating enzyme/nitrite reductase/ring-hydroxylating ferredoxin subunit